MSIQSHISQIAHLTSNWWQCLQSHIFQITHLKSNCQSPLQLHISPITFPISPITYLSNHIPYQITNHLSNHTSLKSHISMTSPVTSHISQNNYLWVDNKVKMMSVALPELSGDNHTSSLPWVDIHFYVAISNQEKMWWRKKSPPESWWGVANTTIMNSKWPFLECWILCSHSLSQKPIFAEKVHCA